MCEMDTQPVSSANPCQRIEDSGGQVALPSGFFDPYAVELERYTKDLCDNGEWTLLDDQAHVTIKTLRQSRYSDITPVIYLQVKFGEPVNPGVTEALLLNPDARKVWDTRLTDFYLVSDAPKQVYYTQLGFPFPFKNREFVEVVSRVSTQEETCIVMYSSDDHFLETDHERGTTHFTVIRIGSGRQVSEVTIVSQYDFKLVFNQQLLVKYIVSIMSEWTKTLVQTVLLNQASH